MDDLLRHSRDNAGRPVSLEDRVRYDIAALNGMDLADLRALWQKLYRTPAPKTFRRELLIRALAYQIQAKAYGGLASKTRRRLLKIATQAEQGTFTTAGAPRRLRPGTRLVRAYEGKTHTVEVLADGFAWDGRKYRSLSGIAKSISGTNWNGNVFFGLTRPTKASQAAKSEGIDG
jgi:hypothetical protein